MPCKCAGRFSGEDRKKRGRTQDFKVFVMSFEQMHLRFRNYVMEPGLFIKTKIEAHIRNY